MVTGVRGCDVRGVHPGVRMANTQRHQLGDPHRTAIARLSVGRPYSTWMKSTVGLLVRVRVSVCDVSACECGWCECVCMPLVSGVRLWVLPSKEDSVRSDASAMRPFEI